MWGKKSPEKSPERFRTAKRVTLLAPAAYLAAMPDDLTLRKAVIGGETKPDDFIVIWDELSIGRLLRSISVGGADGLDLELHDARAQCRQAAAGARAAAQARQIVPDHPLGMSGADARLCNDGLL
jgi:hypothetical protein